MTGRMGMRLGIRRMDWGMGMSGGLRNGNETGMGMGQEWDWDGN